MVHYGRRRVALLVFVERAGSGLSGVAVYMTQCAGRGGYFPNVYSGGLCRGQQGVEVPNRQFGGRVREVVPPGARICPYFVLFRMCRAVWGPASMLASTRSVMLSRSSMWWW